MDEINQEPDCMNRLKFQSRSDLQRICTEAEPYCISTVTILNGFFTQIDRDCAPDCHQGCEEHGYGLFYTECTRCCKSDLCNDYDGRLYYANVCALPSLCLFQLLFTAAITQLLLPI
ncbi:hypothetical protein WR25_26792 [Diploscapter pachys]|uniref:Snake toxin/toxin-like domain-containing protein n=1 Tax=Diploscapter pachys TaxID=2018661 RepID=A0A2A2LWG0_9BILA|nr:hypothetical protein WR25_26792 [Diploscapter pachys]